MQKFVVLVTLLMGLTFASFAQKIVMQRSFGSTRFIMDTVDLSSKQVLYVLKENPVAYQEFKLARKNDTFSGILGASGAFLIAFPIGEAIGGGKPEWGLALAGSALIVCSIPLSKSSTRHAQSALDEYNRKFISRIQSRVFFSPSSVRLIVRF